MKTLRKHQALTQNQPSTNNNFTNRVILKERKLIEEDISLNYYIGYPPNTRTRTDRGITSAMANQQENDGRNNGNYTNPNNNNNNNNNRNNNNGINNSINNTNAIIFPQPSAPVTVPIICTHTIQTIERGLAAVIHSRSMSPLTMEGMFEIIDILRRLKQVRDDITNKLTNIELQMVTNPLDPMGTINQLPQAQPRFIIANQIPLSQPIGGSISSIASSINNAMLIDPNMGININPMLNQSQGITQIR